MQSDTHSIQTLLVANRGEIARRVFRTARAMGIATVAVHSDADAAAPFVGDADVAVHLRGSTSAETYLDIEKLLAAAAATGADAIHPGYGFLAENAGFAHAVLDAGLIWIGPPPAAIATMGDKVEALAAMRAAGVPTLPSVEVGGLDDDELRGAARTIGYPVLVKASAGGGGKGMRVVEAEAQLIEEVAAARRESEKAFGSDVVYLERFLAGGRHIEIQILADRHGTVSHLFERECSIQRRHQKIIEEAPSPFVSPEIRSAMCDAAVAAAAAVSYEGAGTVEFIVDDATGDFYFLEMNTRLQVEHPVTELITGVDLVRQQILVAQGAELALGDLAIDGWAIEARVYAEDVPNGFLPAAGKVVAWHEPPGVRVDSGVATGSEVSIYYDPMLAKVVAGGPTRQEAARRLARALRELRVHGLATNREFLVNVLEHPAFLAGSTMTDFIERNAVTASAAPSDTALRTAAVAAGVAARRRRVGRRDPALPAIEPGWRNVRSAGETTKYRCGDREVTVELWKTRGGDIVGSVDGVDVVAHDYSWADPWLDVDVDGVRQRVTVIADNEVVWVQSALGEVRLTELPRFPRAEREAVQGGLTAPMNGTVVTVAVDVGDTVTAGDTLVIVEAMKMEHRVSAPDDGVVTEVLVAAGDSVAADQVVVVVELPADVEG